MTGMLLACLIGSDLRSGQADLYGKADDSWCHVLATRPIQVLPSPFDVNFSQTFQFDLGTINLGSLTYNQAQHNYVNVSFMTYGRPELRCSPDGETLQSDVFEKGEFMAEYWIFLMVLALGGWFSVMLIKMCFLEGWIRVIKSRDYNCCYQVWVIFDMQAHFIALPTLLLMPLTSLCPLSDDLPHMFSLNVNWAYWTITLVLVVFGLVRLLAYYSCPCDKETHPDSRLLQRCHAGLLWSGVIAVAFLALVMVQLCINVSWTAMFLIDLAVVLRIRISTSLDMAFFAQVFQKAVLFNLIAQYCLLFSQFLHRFDSDDEEALPYDYEEQFQLQGELAGYTQPPRPPYANGVQQLPHGYFHA